MVNDAGNVADYFCHTSKWLNGCPNGSPISPAIGPKSAIEVGSERDDKSG